MANNKRNRPFAVSAGMNLRLLGLAPAAIKQRNTRRGTNGVSLGFLCEPAQNFDAALRVCAGQRTNVCGCFWSRHALRPPILWNIKDLPLARPFLLHELVDVDAKLLSHALYTVDFVGDLEESLFEVSHHDIARGADFVVEQADDFHVRHGVPQTQEARMRARSPAG